jgi:hypothetical protein
LPGKLDVSIQDLTPCPLELSTTKYFVHTSNNDNNGTAGSNGNVNEISFNDPQQKDPSAGTAGEQSQDNNSKKPTNDPSSGNSEKGVPQATKQNTPDPQPSPTNSNDSTGAQSLDENRNHKITVTEVKGQGLNILNHTVVQVDDNQQVGFDPAKDLTLKQIEEEAYGFDKKGTPGVVVPRAESAKTIDQITMHVTAFQASGSQLIIDLRTVDPGNYHVTLRNCDEFVKDVLKGGGINTKSDVFPRNMMKDLRHEQSNGEIPPL